MTSYNFGKTDVQFDSNSSTVLPAITPSSLANCQQIKKELIYGSCSAQVIFHFILYCSLSLYIKWKPRARLIGAKYPIVVVYDYPQGSNTGGYFYPRVRLPPGGYYSTTGVRVPPVLLPYQGTVTPHTQGGTSTLRAGLPPGTPTLPGYDYPPYKGGYFYPARAGLPPGTPTLPGYDYPPIHRGVLLPCQGCLLYTSDAADE